MEYNARSLRPERPIQVFLGKGVLKICSKFTGEHPCRSVISVKLLFNFIEIAFWYGFSPINLLRIFRTLFSKNTSEGLLLLCPIYLVKLSFQENFSSYWNTFHELRTAYLHSFSYLHTCK